MSIGQALCINTLQCRIKALEKEIEEFKSGKRYLKLQDDYKRVIQGYQKTIEELRHQMFLLQKREEKRTDMWYDQCIQDWDNYCKSLECMAKKVEKYMNLCFEEHFKFDKKKAELVDKYEALLAERDREINEKDVIIEKLKEEIKHKEALLNRDGTNTSIPTSQTPIGKKKYVPNTRRSTGKIKGGQPGHSKHILEKIPDELITDTVIHPLEKDSCCPKCGCSDFVSTGEYDDKDVIDVEIVVKRTRHKYENARCQCCGQIVRPYFDPKHRAECQYGPTIQAMALSMMNTTNAAINKIPMMINGETKGEVTPSEGYIAKLQKRAAKDLEQFKEDLRNRLIKRSLIYWDDTVTMINTERGCIRFYGNESIAYYVAHDSKNLEGILKDNILTLLTKEIKVMHDHNCINYNKRFVFNNIECNIHLQRDLVKISLDTGHVVLMSIKDLISKTIYERNDLIASGATKFEEGYKKEFNDRLSGLLIEAEQLAQENESKYTGSAERALVRRIKKYRNNYFAWIDDFSLPTTNNLSERALRGIKSKMKVSGQFASVDTASDYATIRSYVETCRRNGINEMEALIRLCNGKPYTVTEIFGN